jgi:hypothetical protein
MQIVQAPRVATRPGRAAHERRHAFKRQRSEVKQSRRPVRND